MIFQGGHIHHHCDNCKKEIGHPGLCAGCQVLHKGDPFPWRVRLWSEFLNSLENFLDKFGGWIITLSVVSALAWWFWQAVEAGK